jgi:hypothetical protein
MRAAVELFPRANGLCIIPARIARLGSLRATNGDYMSALEAI